MMRPSAGSIVLVDWRRGSLPQEPTKLRPAVVVEDAELFPAEYPNTLVVPLTRDQALAHRAFSERVEADETNGAKDVSWALSHNVTSVSLRRVQLTPSSVTPRQLDGIRQRIALALGIPIASSA